MFMAPESGRLLYCVKGFENVTLLEKEEVVAGLYGKEEYCVKVLEIGLVKLGLLKVELVKPVLILVPKGLLNVLVFPKVLVV